MRRSFRISVEQAGKLPVARFTRHPTSVVVNTYIAVVPCLRSLDSLVSSRYAGLHSSDSSAKDWRLLCMRIPRKILLAKPLGGLALRAIPRQASRLRAQLFQVSSQLSSFAPPRVSRIDHRAVKRPAGRNGKIQGIQGVDVDDGKYLDLVPKCNSSFPKYPDPSIQCLF